MPAPTKMQKYLYKANAIALRGSIRKPYFQELGDHLAVSTYAGSGGRIECKSEGFAIGEELHYDSARTEIIASQEDGVFTTSVTAQVFGLQVGKRFTVEEVTCRLQSVYDSRLYPEECFPRISPIGSTIRNLRIDGEVQRLMFAPAFDAREGEPGFIPEPIYVRDFGTIYYAEWTWVHPQERHQQHLTMLRLALGSDTGAAVCFGIGSSDGTGWPPTS
jgi:hypothetical protein